MSIQNIFAAFTKHIVTTKQNVRKKATNNSDIINITWTKPDHRIWYTQKRRNMET